VHEALVRIATGQIAPTPPEPLVPAVSIKKSITADYLICLDDGKKFKTLRRHLTALGMTPDQYREKWNLPSDYPMVARDYAAARSALAKNFGLGHTRKKTDKPKLKGLSRARKKAAGS
jgi:predicted transcriptional regulator